MRAVNFTDRTWTNNRYTLQVAHIKLMIWANDVNEAFDHAVDWCAENAPGLLQDDILRGLYDEALAEGLDEDDAYQRASDGLLCGGNFGNHLLASECHILAVNPTRAQVRANK